MVHCIHNKHNQNKKKETNYLEIDEINEEMMLLSTKDVEENSSSAIDNTTNNATTINDSTATKQICKPEEQQQSIQKQQAEQDDQKLKSKSMSVLSYDQVNRLHNVIKQTVPIHGRGNFPTLKIELKKLIKLVRTKLETEQSIRIQDVRLNGGAASHVLLSSTYNDLDLIFAVDLSDPKNYDKIRTAVLDSLLEFLPKEANRDRISLTSLKDAYIHKMVKVNEKVDKWSLISLNNNTGRNVELKFVHKMQRQFEFSVDSFHIILDSLMLFYECSEMPIVISENIYPTVISESVYGDFKEAFSHLENKIIATRQVEQIRGGGLLKYCNLLIRNYSPSDDIKTLERYMCSRFFIDFSELPTQRNKLESYLANHFNNDDWTKTQYLMQLYKVVDESTVCLMSHERRQTLQLIEEMAYRFYIRSHQQPTTQQPSHPPHHYPFHISHIGKQSNQFFPHFHHHLIRHHPNLIVGPQQTTQQSNKQQSNQQSNDSTNSSNSNKNSSSTTNHNSSTNAAKNNSCSTNSNNSNSSTAQQSTHSSTNNSTSNCRNSTKNHQQQQQHQNSNQQSQQHIQQQYHAYLFGTNGNAFYFNPYHHSMHHQAHGCFNQMSCQCARFGYINGCA